LKKARRADIPSASTSLRSTGASPATGGAARGTLQSFVEVAVAAVVALALTFAAFAPGLRAAFVSDDINAIVENEWVAGPFDPVGIFRHLSWWSAGRADSSGYRPATTLSFAANRHLTGADPYGFRIVNFAWNAAAAALLFALCRMLGLGLAVSGAAAAVFTVLPIHSEAVIWIVGRAEIAAAAAFLLIAITSAHYRRNGAPLLPVAGAAMIFAGLAFKENAVTALAIPWILFVAGERDRVVLRRDAVMFAALVAGCVAYGVLRASAIGPTLLYSPASLLDNPLSVVGYGTRVLGAVAVLGRYVRLMVWPSALSIDYSYDALGIREGFLANADSVIAVIFVAVAVAAALRASPRRGAVVIGLLLAAASYSIVSNTVVLVGTILGERLFYLPTAGLLVAAAAVADPFVARAQGNTAMVSVAMIVLVVAASVHADRGRAAEWQTPVTLFEAAVRAVPGSARAHMELATAYGSAGRVDEATRHFARSLAILPDYTSAAYNQGNTFARAGRYDEAVAAYERALAIDPKFVRAWHNLALTQRLRRNPAGWLEAMRRTAALQPDAPALQSELAEALLANGRYDEAVSVYDAVVAGGGGGAAYFNRGVARHHIAGCTAAVDDYRRATSSPGAPREAFAAAAGCLRQLGRSDEALAIEQAGKVANRDTRR
jgi:protein O-mannosyl-transferase